MIVAVPRESWTTSLALFRIKVSLPEPPISVSIPELEIRVSLPELAPPMRLAVPVKVS